MQKNVRGLQTLLNEARSCQICKEFLPNEPRPVLRASTTAKLLVVGQAPGIRVHNTGIPWNDPSGDRLRQWMGLTRGEFYNEDNIAIIPMGFCYPGTGRAGDLPPRKECAAQWHDRLLSFLPDLELTLLIGQYAQNYYLPKTKANLTERVRQWEQFLPEKKLPLPHPSPRNLGWLKRNPWFYEEVIPFLQAEVKKLL